MGLFNKKIKGSQRGLTFSLEDASLIGSKFRYIIDKDKSEILIVADKNGNGTVSRKQSGNKYKPLYDIRSKEVKELVSNADYLELSVDGSSITVQCLQKVKKLSVVKGREFVNINDVLCCKTSCFTTENILTGTGFEQISFFDSPEFMSAFGSSFTKKDRSDFTTVYKVASLFSGAGLLDYSFKDPRIKFVYAVDFDKDACETYRENIGDHIRCQDIRTVNASDVPDTDIIIGGPCCQGYSNANRNNIDSETAESKRLLIDDYIRVVKHKQPDVFVIENVPSLLTAGEGKYIERVFTGLSEYEITTTIVEDGKLGGYTTRKRAIIIGSKIGEIHIPDKKISVVNSVRTALEKVDHTWFNFEDVTMPRESTRIAMSYVKQGGNWKDIPESVHKFGPSTQSNTYRRLAWDELSPTITNWRKCLLLHPEKDRILSVSEASALMGLGKEFKILGSSLNSRQQQIGNGVTQAIGRAIKEAVINALDHKIIKREGLFSAS